MKAHTPLMYAHAGSEQSWNGGRIMITSFFGVAKVGSGNKGFSVDGFYVRGSTVHQTYPPTK